MTDHIYRAPPLDDGDILAPTLAHMINLCVEKQGAGQAFSCILPNGQWASISYQELGRYSDAVAAYAVEELQCKPGDVVAIQCPNCLAYPVVAFGLLKAGVVVTNINPLYTAEETQHQLQDSKAKVLFVIDVFADRLEEALHGTAVDHICLMSLVDFFPTPKRLLLSAAMKHLKRMIPKPAVPIDDKLRYVIRKGERYMRSGFDPSHVINAIDPQQTAFYQYTGGTTGRSKGARLSHHNVICNVSQGHVRNRSVIRQGEEVMMLALPLYHVYALAVGALASMYNGTHVVLVPAPRPVSNLKPVFETFDITTMPGVNTLYVALLHEAWFKQKPPRNLRYCYAGAAPLQQSTAHEWEKLTGAPIFEGYGLTESTCLVTSMPLDEEPRRGTSGKAVAGTELRIIGEDGENLPFGEVGELMVRGPQVMQGYLNNPDVTAETVSDGWLHTGDIAKVSEDGYLTIVDRKKDMVLVSGFNVYPADVEDIITLHPDISDAAVVGGPDAETGERVVAFVVSKDKELSTDLLRAHCREHLTNYKIPKEFRFVDELPKSPVGKILRRSLRDQLYAEAQ